MEKLVAPLFQTLGEEPSSGTYLVESNEVNRAKQFQVACIVCWER